MMSPECGFMSKLESTLKQRHASLIRSGHKLIFPVIIMHCSTHKEIYIVFIWFKNQQSSPAMTFSNYKSELGAIPTFLHTQFSEVNPFITNFDIFALAQLGHEWITKLPIQNLGPGDTCFLKRSIESSQQIASHRNENCMKSQRAVLCRKNFLVHFPRRVSKKYFSAQSCLTLELKSQHLKNKTLLLIA